MSKLADPTRNHSFMGLPIDIDREHLEFLEMRHEDPAARCRKRSRLWNTSKKRGDFSYHTISIG